MNVDFLTERGSGSVNEDQILMADPVFGVFDGATSLNKYVDESGKTGGLLASTIARETFKKENKSLLALATEANESILHVMRKKGIDTGDKQKLWATSAAVVRIVEKEVEWLTISDSIIMVFDTNGRHTLLGEFHNHDVVSLKLWKEHAEQRVEKISEKLTDVM